MADDDAPAGGSGAPEQPGVPGYPPAAAAAPGAMPPAAPMPPPVFNPYTIPTAGSLYGAPSAPTTPARRQRSSSGCGFILLVLVVLGAVVGGFVLLVVRNEQKKTPREERQELIDALQGVCDTGKAAPDAAPYRRGDPTVLGAIAVPSSSSPDVIPLAGTADAASVISKYDRVGLLGCIGDVTDQESVPCTFRLQDGSSTTVMRATRVTASLQIVDARTGKVLQTTPFEARQSATCPTQLVYMNGNVPTRDGPPLSEPVEGIMKNYHQG